MLNIRGQYVDDRSEFMSPMKSVAASMAFAGFSAHVGPGLDTEGKAGRPSTTKLIEKFTNMYQEIELRLERGLSFAKEATLENKLRASSNSALIGGLTANDVTCDMIDLKAELTSMKNKLFQAEQKRIEETKQRDAKISSLQQ